MIDLISWYSLVDSCSRRNERKAAAFIVQQAVLKRKPWVPEDLFFLTIMMVRGEAKSTRREAPREKITSGHRSFESHFHAVLGSYISSNRFGTDVHVCFHWRWQLGFDGIWLYVCDAWIKNCAKAYLERKVLLGKKDAPRVLSVRMQNWAQQNKA